MISDTYKKPLLRHYHWLCRQLGITQEEKEAIKESYGVKSSRNFTADQLSQIIDNLMSGSTCSVQTVIPEGDIWRKRVMAAIGGWLRAVNRNEGVDVIKAIACRASGYDRFNRIPVSRLRDLYYEFTRKAKTTEEIQMVKDDIVNNLALMN